MAQHAATCRNNAPECRNNHSRYTRNPEPEPRTPKPETRNPKPETRNPKQALMRRMSRGTYACASTYTHATHFRVHLGTCVSRLLQPPLNPQSVLRGGEEQVAEHEGAKTEGRRLAETALQLWSKTMSDQNEHDMACVANVAELRREGKERVDELRALLLQAQHL